jgi:hypothetical protein
MPHHRDPIQLEVFVNNVFNRLASTIRSHVSETVFE